MERSFCFCYRLYSDVSHPAFIFGFCSYVLTCVVFILFFHISLFDVRGYVWDGVCHVLLFEVNARGQRSKLTAQLETSRLVLGNRIQTLSGELLSLVQCNRFASGSRKQSSKRPTAKLPPPVFNCIVVSRPPRPSNLPIGLLRPSVIF